MTPSIDTSGSTQGEASRWFWQASPTPSPLAAPQPPFVDTRSPSSPPHVGGLLPAPTIKGKRDSVNGLFQLLTSKIRGYLEVSWELYLVITA